MSDSKTWPASAESAKDRQNVNWTQLDGQDVSLLWKKGKTAEMKELLGLQITQFGD